MYSFEVNIRICQPEKVMFTEVKVFYYIPDKKKKKKKKKERKKRTQYSLHNYNKLRIVDKIFILEQNLL